MEALCELIAVLVPWLAIGLAVPVLLYAVRAILAAIDTAADRRKAWTDRKHFAAYTRRGHY